MDPTLPPEEGDYYSFERTFTEADVREFGDLSGDRQAIHTDPDEEGRLVVQGLLTATLPTKIGGDLSYVARSMAFEFRRPVRTGETIVCEWTNETVEEGDDRWEVSGRAVCRNETGDEVMTFESTGVVWKEG